MSKLIIFFIFTFLYSQCDDLMQYFCTLKPECEWITSQESGDCADLNESDCMSGNYNYCYWTSSYNGASSCIGGQYTLNKGECEETRNILDKYVSGKVDDALINILIENGFEKRIENNRTYLFIDFFELSYKEIQTHTSGIKIVKPKIILEEDNEFVMIVTMDFISLNLSVIDMITYIEQLYYHDQVPKISYLDIHYKNTVFNMKSVTPGNLGEIEYSIADAKGVFDGYINQKIIDDFDDNIKIPNFNQTTHININGFEINKFIGKNGKDALIEPLKIFSLESLASSLYKVDSCELKASFLPEQDKAEIYLKLDHPILGFDMFLSSNADFDLTNPPNTIWKSGKVDANAYLNLPSHINLNLYKLPMFMYRPILPATLPGKITLGLGANYSDNLNAFIKSLDEGDPFIDNNAQIRLSGGLDNLGFDIADSYVFMQPYNDNISYIRFNIDNFDINGSLDRNKINVNSTLNTNFFNAKLIGDIDMYDIENPWINKLNLNISNITPVCENYITLIEKESGINFERLYNAINIELTGYLNHPTIKGFTIINQ